MAGRKGHKLMEFSVPEDVRDILLKASIEKDTDIAPALSAIVREWAKIKEIDPLKSTPNLSDLEHLANNLDSIVYLADKTKAELKRMNL